MTTAAERKKKVNRGYVDFYLKRRLPDGTYDADWTDISRLVDATGLSTLDYRLDSDDFDVGLFVVANIPVTFLNKTGKFNDPADPRSLWASHETRHLSMIKVEAGYFEGSVSAPTKIIEVVFQGIWDDRTVETLNEQDAVKAQILSREAIFQTVNVVAGSLSSAVLASAAVEVLCTRGAVLAHMTVSAANINPGNDVTIDDPTDFNGKKLNDVLVELCLLTNSVLYIDEAGALVMRGRSAVGAAQVGLYQNAEGGQSDNIYAITNYNGGRQRLKNYWEWQGTTTVAKSEPHHLARYGLTKRVVNSDAILVPATRTLVLEALRDEWQFPKREMEVETDYTANDVSFFDLVTVDVRPSYDRLTDLPIAGSAICGTARCAGYASGLFIDKNLGWKVIGIRHDLRSFKTVLKLREKGTQLNDGYFHMLISKAVAVVFTAESSRSIDTSLYGINSQYCKVEVLDAAGDYVTSEFNLTRPTTSSLILTAGAAISGTFRVLLLEVEA